MMAGKGRLLAITLGALLVAVLISLRGGTVPLRAGRIRVPVEPLTVMAGSRMGGTVAEVCVHPGDAVIKDQALVRFDATLLHQQRASLETALHAMRSGMASVKLPEMGRRLLVDAHPDVARAEARYVAALAESEKQPDDAHARREVDREAAQRMETRRRVGGMFTNAANTSATISQMEMRLADVERALADTEVRAPVAALVDLLDLHPGDKVLPAQPAAMLIQPGEYYCDFASRLPRGTSGKGALDSGESFEWRVDSVTLRTIPFALRERRDQAEERWVRARFSARTPWVAGLHAELQIP